MRAALIATALLLAPTACSYDYSRVPIGPAPRPDGGGSFGTDAGSRFTCDPIVQTCSATLHCGMVSDASGQLSARCVLPGTGSASAGCDGPEDCAPGYYCRSVSASSMLCESFCTDASPSCADGRACDTSSTLFAVGGHTGHRCR